MMTLKELKEKVEVAEKRRYTPKAKVLLESDSEIVASKVIDKDSQVMVFQNGYVLYISGKHATVFALHTCRAYNYGTGVTKAETIKEELFDNENWYIRLVLEGEDRIMLNREKHHQKNCISYNVGSEDWNQLKDVRNTPEVEVVTREYIYELLNQVSDRAAYAIRKHYAEEEILEEIGEVLHIQKGAVSKLINNNIMKIRKTIEMEEITVSTKEN